MPRLELLWRRYGPEGLVVVGVEVSGDGELTRRFAADWGLSFPLVRQEPRQTDVSYGMYKVSFCPQTFVIDRSGEIHFYQGNFSPVDSARLEQQVRELLAERP